MSVVDMSLSLGSCPLQIQRIRSEGPGVKDVHLACESDQGWLRVVADRRRKTERNDGISRC